LQALKIMSSLLFRRPNNISVNGLKG
jgi:hypothetical protein